MGLGFGDIAAAVVLNLLHVCSANSEDILPCDAHALYPCPDENQYCNQTAALCMCDEGYVLVGKKCESRSDVPDSHSGVVALVVILTIVLIIGGLALVVKKYNLVEYVREKINARRSGEVMYEDVMIGQDDPPLSP